MWNSEAHLRIIPSETGKWGFTVEECGKLEADVKGYSITSIMEKYDISQFDIVKMDIEGSEFYVFKDDKCEEWIGNTKVLVIEMHDEKVKGCSNTVMDRMTRLGYQFFKRGENYVFFKN